MLSRVACCTAPPGGQLQGRGRGSSWRRGRGFRTKDVVPVQGSSWWETAELCKMCLLNSGRHMRRFGAGVTPWPIVDFVARVSHASTSLARLLSTNFPKPLPRISKSPYTSHRFVTCSMRLSKPMARHSCESTSCEHLVLSRRKLLSTVLVSRTGCWPLVPPQLQARRCVSTITLMFLD